MVEEEQLQRTTYLSTQLSRNFNQREVNRSILIEMNRMHGSVCHEVDQIELLYYICIITLINYNINLSC